jgi:penicillin-binding protein 2
MRGVISDPKGTARAVGANAPWAIAGKSGTAQVFTVAQDETYNKDDLAERMRDHALFVAFAPADEPRIAVAVIVENGGSGSGVAGPLARKVMDTYLGSAPL